MILKKQFLIQLRQQYIDAFLRYEPGRTFEQKEWDFLTGKGRVAVQVFRGSVFEKVCVSEIMATVVIPGRDYESTIQWLGIQTFPANPAVPMFMGVFENVQEQGLEHCPCYFDVYPAVAFDEDRRALAEEMAAVCKQYGRTYPDLPDGYLKMFQLKDAGIGVGYGTGMALGPEEDNQKLFEDVANAALTSYFDVVDKRKDAPYTAAHTEAMYGFRARWVNFIYRENRFFQGGVGLGVPVESFMLHMLPPTVRF